MRACNGVAFLMSEAWSIEENRRIVDDYVDMLKLELSGETFIKSARNEALREHLNGRTKGSVEFKHQNISAVMIMLGLPYIEGYKPAGNFQDSLLDVAIAKVMDDGDLQNLVAGKVAAPAVRRVAPTSNRDDFFVPVPVREIERGKVRETPIAPRRLTRVNYLEQEARNSSLGLAGEKFVMELEHQRLWTAGARDLADRIEHVSAVQGDGAGYDVLSYDTSGRERLIEVKTTRFGALTPFFATRNEVAVSEKEASRYHTYRVFKFDDSPKVFVLDGSMRTAVQLDPMLYQASIL